VTALRFIYLRFYFSQSTEANIKQFLLNVSIYGFLLFPPSSIPLSLFSKMPGPIFMPILCCDNIKNESHESFIICDTLVTIVFNRDAKIIATTFGLTAGVNKS